MQKRTEIYTQRSYKDTLFRMLFQEKEDLLSLYNAINETNYDNADDLEITTLENAVYMNYKNDVSFLFNFELMLYEHQSTINPNMPFRHLIYVSKTLSGITRNENLYGSALIMLPTPRFAIFYNGTDLQPEQQTLRLSDSYSKKRNQPELELIVTVYNINRNCNSKLLQACRRLREYAEYVEQVREFAKEMPFAQAVERAVEFCIQNGILADFLLKNRAEAIEMSIFEYDEENHLKSEREFAYKNGFEKGEQQGFANGIQIFILNSHKEGASKENIIQKLKNYFALTPENAEKHYEEAMCVLERRLQ